MKVGEGGETIEIPDQDVASYVLEHAAERGERPALIDGPSGRTITYGELAEKSAALAAGLASRGFGKGDSFCIYMPNVPEYAIAFYGAAMTGGCATTANPLYTPRELQHQLDDSGARFLLTIPDFLETANKAAEAAGVEEVFVLGEAEGATPFAELFGDAADAPEVEIDPEDIAVLPYSSGTTGLPKGVMLTHRNLVANIQQIQACNPIDDSDVEVGCLPFFHIYGQTVIMNQGLREGALIVTMPRFDLGQFLELIAEHKVTRTFVVPPIALALAKHPSIDEADLSTVKTVMSGAAALGAELQQKVAERIGAAVFQGYGMTELSPVSHVIRESGRNKPGSIGPAIPDTECRLVDPESGEDVTELGERGELWIRGPQVMKGYLNNDEATAETIVEGDWLRTGDIAVRDEDDYYEIVDRLKELIKFKGFQVAPAELEGLIINHPKVADVAVIGVADEECGELPKAFIVPTDSGDFDEDELKAFVAEQVSPQKRIRLVELIDEIPKSASGKILRRQLRDREHAA